MYTLFRNRIRFRFSETRAIFLWSRVLNPFLNRIGFRFSETPAIFFCAFFFTCAHSFSRKQLWCEHLGLHIFSFDYSLLGDPIHQNAYNLWRKTAVKNSELFRQLFPGIPDDRVQSLTEISKCPKLVPGGHMMMSHVKGHLVQFPLNFLRDSLEESIDFTSSSVGDDVFT